MTEKASNKNPVIVLRGAVNNLFLNPIMGYPFILIIFKKKHVEIQDAPQMSFKSIFIKEVFFALKIMSDIEVIFSPHSTLKCNTG